MQPLIDRLLPAPRNSGFKCEGYHVWCGSMIKVDNTYHLFASRWPHASGFPDGYRTRSEIVRAVADNPLGPFTMAEVVFSGRGGEWWDGKMCHNPKIASTGNTYVLYYIGSRLDSRWRMCGYAHAKSIEGPWVRSDMPMDLGMHDHNNPAPIIHDGGRAIVAFRNEVLVMYMAEADSFDSPYRVVGSDLFPGTQLEDPDIHFADGQYHMVIEDHHGKFTGHTRFGAHLVSDDCLAWRAHESVCAYTHTLQWDDGTATVAERRERPELFNAEAPRKGFGAPTHLITAVLAGGESWCHVQGIAPA